MEKETALMAQERDPLSAPTFEGLISIGGAFDRLLATRLGAAAVQHIAVVRPTFVEGMDRSRQQPKRGEACLMMTGHVTCRDEPLWRRKQGTVWRQG
jgi:hypothetical protein